MLSTAKRSIGGWRSCSEAIVILLVGSAGGFAETDARTCAGTLPLDALGRTEQTSRFLGLLLAGSIRRIRVSPEARGTAWKFRDALIFTGGAGSRRIAGVLA